MITSQCLLPHSREPVRHDLSNDLGHGRFVVVGGHFVEESGSVHGRQEQCDALRVIACQFVRDAQRRFGRRLA